MPRPPVLEKVDWKEIFATGLSYQTWTANAESEGNRERMEDSKKALTLEISIEGHLKAFGTVINIMVIAEDWCGDVVRHVPVLQKMVEVNPKINVKFFTRDACLNIFPRFLTNGGEAIPKFIFFNQDFVECGNWGPMPSMCKEIIAKGKACGDVKSAREQVASLYKIDHQCRIVVKELLQLMDIASTISV